MAKTLHTRLRKLWDNARRGVGESDTQLVLPLDHIDVPGFVGTNLVARQHYFQVRVNQLFLAYQREWFVKYDPMVLVITEFLYGQEFVAVPFLVGPSIFDSKGIQIPVGTVIRDARVAGVHPYRGDRLILRVILYKTQRENAVRHLLGFIERAALAIDYSTSLMQYMKLADIVVDGIEGLLGLGQTEPVLAYSKEFDPQAGDRLQETFFALIDKPRRDIDPERVWVVDNQLEVTKGSHVKAPYSDADFVLLSLRCAQERNDVDRLPFYPLWEQALRDAVVPNDKHWQLAKASLLSLYQSMILSPDLTDPHISRLKEEYVRNLQMRHREALELSAMGTRSPEKAEDLLDEREALLGLQP